MRTLCLVAALSLAAGACGDDGGGGTDAAVGADAAAGGDGASAIDAAGGPDGALTADGAPDDGAMYTAVAMPGGLDRVRITRVSTADQTCMMMTLVSPMTVDGFDIDIPDPWRIESIARWAQTTCTGDMNAFADTATGTITFGGLDALSIYPCLLSFDVDINFPAAPTSVWNVQDVPVAGVTCS
jgi:hypothetical protein